VRDTTSHWGTWPKNAFASLKIAMIYYEHGCNQTILKTQTDPNAMPLYEYECRHCGMKIEKLESMRAPQEQDCGACHTALGLHRVTSLTAFALSGDAWYAGGYSRENKLPTSAPKSETTPPSSPSPSQAPTPSTPTPTPSATPSVDKKP